MATADLLVNRKVAEAILQSAGCTTASGVDEAQGVAASRDTPFDAILMDMQMPVMDGLCATRAIRSREAAEGRPRLPIIMVTANVEPIHRAAAEAAGADLHLPKPIDMLVLWKRSTAC
nr:response regulator [Phenylobacterium sp.]